MLNGSILLHIKQPIYRHHKKVKLILINFHRTNECGKFFIDCQSQFTTIHSLLQKRSNQMELPNEYGSSTDRQIILYNKSIAYRFLFKHTPYVLYNDLGNFLFFDLFL